MKFSNRIMDMQESPIRKLVPIADKAKKRGKKIYHLNIGQPDIETPKEFFEAVRNFDEQVLEYSSSQGIPELIDGFIGYYEKYGIDFKEDDIIVTNGGSEGLLFSLLATCDNGDEVIVPEPFYANYNSFTSAAGVKVVPLITKAETGFHLPNKEEIVSLITDKTKAIIVNNPGNPTGTIYSKKEIRMLSDIAKEYNLFIISDEVYREFIYNDTSFTSFAHIDDIKDRVVIIDSISKRYSACGARVGCIASKNTDLISQVLKLCQSRLCVATIDQVGAAALASVSKEYLDNVVKEYKKRRDIVYNSLNNIEGVVCQKPEGAFYVIAKLPVKNAEDFIIWMLEEFDIDNETLMLSPAQGFYATEGLGLDEVRISYVLKEDSLKKAMNILKEGLKLYKDRN
ncbi:aspartate aminotransferase AspC [Gottschalkia purinilytica]|uniref:Aminotransferase n=1 Tax=Gottschalkia purinilytica TaxID=1503 RepID=A0A0L0WBT1_GOTPU|nr:pyridoxal phosphate-dependent aminotransferase [Gottschalkia purinilytica]KNF08946.1 aspartate aminotransferase AspC [Gottschalkia purinilytica]